MAEYIELTKSEADMINAKRREQAAQEYRDTVYGEVSREFSKIAGYFHEVRTMPNLNEFLGRFEDRFTYPHQSFQVFETAWRALRHTEIPDLDGYPCRLVGTGRYRKEESEK